MPVRTYSPEEVVVIFAGVRIQGFSEDTMVEIEPTTTTAARMVGADGEVARSISADRTATVTMTLMQTSASNDVLSGFYQLDRATGGGGTFPLLVKDLRGRTVFSAASAWISNLPTVAFGREAGEREWALETGQAEWFVGGNT